MSIRPRLANSVAASLLIAITSASVARPVLADADAAKVTLAETLFGDAKKLMKEGKYAEACPKLVESQKLDPGGGTLILLAECHEGEGKLARAWSEYRDALAIAIRDKRPERIDRCNQRLAAIEPKLSRVTITLPAAADAEGLAVTLDGAEFPRAAFGTALPVDPGKHVVRATAPNREPREYTFEVGETASTPTVVLEPLAASTKKPDVAPPASTVVVDNGKSRRAAGYVFVGAAVVAIGVGAFFGLRAIDKRKDSDEHCPGDRCDQLGVDLNDSAKSSANVANVAIGLGVVSAIVGGVLILGAPKAETRTMRITPTVGPTVAGVSFGMSF